jgi:hypothetical protein
LRKNIKLIQKKAGAVIDASPLLPAGAVALARLGRRIRWLVLLYILALTLALTATTLLWPRLLAQQPALAGLGLDPAALPLGGRVAAFLALALPTLPILWATGEALALCRRMAGGQVFTPGVPLHLRRMGMALVAAGLSQPFGGALLSLAVSSFAGAGERHVALALSSDHVGVAVIGAVLIAVAAAAREAVRLADENARFI